VAYETRAIKNTMTYPTSIFHAQRLAVAVTIVYRRQYTYIHFVIVKQKAYSFITYSTELYFLKHLCVKDNRKTHKGSVQTPVLVFAERRVYS
jgi:hypothetical protein